MSMAIERAEVGVSGLPGSDFQSVCVVSVFGPAFFLLSPADIRQPGSSDSYLFLEKCLLLPRAYARPHGLSLLCAFVGQYILVWYHVWLLGGGSGTGGTLVDVSGRLDLYEWARGIYTHMFALSH